jgi:potassium-dependent mechanosensitive channel
MRGWFSCIALLLLMWAAPALSQSTSDALLAESETQIEALKRQIGGIKVVIESPGATDEKLLEQRTLIEALNSANAAQVAKLKGPLTEVQAQLTKLGPAPQAEATEIPQIAAQRKLLNSRFEKLTALQTQLELLRLEADQNTSRILALQRDQFFERIFRPDKSILNPGMWFDALSNVRTFNSRVGMFISNWWREVKDEANLGGIIVLPSGLLFLLMIWKFMVKRFVSRFGRAMRREGAAQMTSMARLLRVILGVLLGTLFFFFASLLIFAALDVSQLLTDGLESVVTSIVGLLASVTFSFLLTYLICAPRRSEARLVSVDDAAARSIPFLVAVATFAKGTTEATSGLSNVLNLPVSLTAGQTAVSALVLIGLLAMLLVIIRKQASREVGEGKSYFLTWFVQLLPVIWILLGLALFALVLGYISLGYFIAANILDTALLAIILAIVHYLADAVSDTLLNPASWIGHSLRSSLSFSEKAIARISLILRTATDVVLFLIALPALFAIWTVTWIDVSTIRGAFVNGITIGNITLSPWGIIVAAAVLAIGIALTRTLTSWLQQRVLSETTLDKGVQNSIKTASRYVGYILAFALAMAAAGIDFSNIAIIAGALGVGIGFGLQSIVNNFVSGLILLAERPIRVGDWVETEKGEGVVKKINVRSTEIETFDSCTVFVPNSTLITQTVRNWTHRDTVGRLSISVMVDDANNADRVADVLLDVVRQNPKILRYPEPSVLLVRFAPKRLEFDVKGHISDVFEVNKISSEIRFAIARAFDAKKIKYATA